MRRLKPLAGRGTATEPEVKSKLRNQARSPDFLAGKIHSPLLARAKKSCIVAYYSICAHATSAGNWLESAGEQATRPARIGFEVMTILTSRTAALLFFLILAAPAAGESASNKICAAATSYLVAKKIPIGAETLLASATIDGAWIPLPHSDTAVGAPPSAVYLAYFFYAPYVYNARSTEAVGAVSIKISVLRGENTPKTTSIALYRSAIARGTNRCEPYGRTEIDERRVRINEYIDHHAKRGNSSNLESFHFRYPYATSECARTDRPDEVAATFQFPGVNRTSGDTLIARSLGEYFGQAYALNHEFSLLRSELHYYHRADTMTPACVGFLVPLSGSEKNASILIHDLSSNFFSDRGSWLIHRQ
jgi:hypothetical protein